MSSSQSEPSASHPTRRPLLSPEAFDIEDILQEIRRRAVGATVAQERLGELLDAVVAIASNLELPEVLDRIVESACNLVGARYGALGVLDSSGRSLAAFLTHGVSTEQRERIGAPPCGRGIIGLLITDARTHRIDDITAHAASAGIPADHPSMTTFIGTPLRVRDQLFGNLYLTEKIGGGGFTDDDEKILEGLAAAAGIAVENAQLYARARARQQWSQAVSQLTQTLLEGRNEQAALARMVKQARELAEAYLGVLAMRDEEGRLVVQAVERGDGGPTPTLGSVLRCPDWPVVLHNRSPLVLATRHDDGHVSELVQEVTVDLGVPPVGVSAIVPITVGEQEVGIMTLSWPEEVHACAVETLELVSSFVSQMGLAIETGRAQRQRSRARLLEDRDRIARDMHDHVIQRLYAAGLSLQAAARTCEDDIRDRLDGTVDELDLAVKDIRQAIFELHQRLPDGGLGPEIEALVERVAEAIGFVPDLVIEGVLADVPPGLEQDVIAVVREGLSNVVQHSRARDAEVRVSALDDLIVSIRDDGVGVPEEAVRSGLISLENRASAHGGVFSVSARHPRGTLLRWRVPLS